MTLDTELRNEIEALIKDNRVTLFMKGSRHFPQCGFSARVVGILDDLIEEFHTVDVLSRPDIHQGVREYTDWPTIPQLYIDANFVGGCDIVTDMSASGELHKLLGIEIPEVEPPEITITDSAAGALLAALPAAGNDMIRLSINKQFQHGMTIGPQQQNDLIIESNGVRIAINPFSAQRANGLKLDHSGDTGQGFNIDNPNQPS